MFQGKGHPQMGDRVTSSQRKVLNSKNLKKMFVDSDRDGVIDGLDCKPKNKHKHSMYTENYQMQRQRVKDAYQFFPMNATQKYISLQAMRKHMEDQEVKKDV